MAKILLYYQVSKQEYSPLDGVVTIAYGLLQHQKHATHVAL